MISAWNMESIKSAAQFCTRNSRFLFD